VHHLFFGQSGLRIGDLIGVILDTHNVALAPRSEYYRSCEGTEGPYKHQKPVILSKKWMMRCKKNIHSEIKLCPNSQKRELSKEICRFCRSGLERLDSGSTWIQCSFLPRWLSFSVGRPFERHQSCNCSNYGQFCRSFRCPAVMLCTHWAIAYFYALPWRVWEGGFKKLRKYGCWGLWVSLKLFCKSRWSLIVMY